MKPGVTFTVPGKPATQGDHKGFFNAKTQRVIIAEANKSVGPWRARVALASNMAWDGRPLLDGVPVRVKIEFVLPRPGNTPKTRVTPPAVKKNADIDKMTRGVLDGITHTILADDGQVIELWCRKRIAELNEGARAIITVEEMQWPTTK